MTALVLALLLQTVSATLAPATPFQIEWLHTGEWTPVFRFWCDGAIVKTFKESEPVRSATKDADGYYTYTGTVPGLPVGAHPCFVSAYNGAAESLGDAKGDPVVFTVAAPLPPQKIPPVPLKLKLIVPVGGGA